MYLQKTIKLGDDNVWAKYCFLFQINLAKLTLITTFRLRLLIYKTHKIFRNYYNSKMSSEFELTLIILYLLKFFSEFFLLELCSPKGINLMFGVR